MTPNAPRVTVAAMATGRKFSIALAMVIGMAVLSSCTYDNIVPSRGYNAAHSECVQDETICLQDDNSMSVFADSLPQPWSTAAQMVLINSYHTTDLNVSFTGAPIYARPDDGETDVILQMGSLPGHELGIYVCEDVDNTHHCDQAYVTFDHEEHCSIMDSSSCMSAMAIAPTVCHETGHSVGLLHGEDAFPPVENDDSSLECMETDLPNYRNASALLGSHNVSMINSEY